MVGLNDLQVATRGLVLRLMNAAKGRNQKRRNSRNRYA